MAGLILIFLGIFLCTDAKWWWVGVMLIFFGCTSHAKTLRIGVIDSGFKSTTINDNSSYNPVLCDNITYRTDTVGHGTAVISAIAKRLNDAHIDYCIIPFYTDFWDKTYLQAVNQAEAANLDLLNVSVYGYDKVPGECLSISRMIHEGVVVITASGNDSIDKVSYPGACHNDTYKIYNVDVDGKFTTKSNTYKEPLNRAVKEQGINISVLSLDGGITTMSGTSFAAAITTAKMAIAIAKEARCYESKGTSRTCY